MTKEERSVYTNRIAEANKTGIIDILYDMLYSDIEDGKEAAELKDYAALRASTSHGSLVLQHLKDALDFKYELSYQLYPLYVFCQGRLESANLKADKEKLLEAERIITPLRDAFKEIAKNDSSEKVMKHTENMVAGMTYGKKDLSLVDASYDRNRGFTA